VRLVLPYGTRCQWKVIIIIRDKLSLNTLVWALSDRLLTGLPSCLHPFGLHFNIILDKLLFILVTYHSQSDLCLLRFSSAGSAFSCTKISSFLLWQKKGVPCCSYENFLLCQLRVPVPNILVTRRAGTTIIMGHVVAQLVTALEA
jgi:hypothetical protein